MSEDLPSTKNSVFIDGGTEHPDIPIPVACPDGEATSLNLAHVEGAGATSDYHVYCYGNADSGHTIMVIPVTYVLNPTDIGV